MSFFDKLNKAIALHQTLLVAALDPNPEMMPQPQASRSDSDQLLGNLREWLLAIIAATSSHVCAYKPTLGFYTALGLEGWELLREVLKAIPDHLPIILDAKHGDLNTSTIFARTIFQEWQVDAITITPYAGQDNAAPFLLYPDKAVFVLCHTSNPGAVSLQKYSPDENPFYLRVVEEVKAWGTQEQLCLEVGSPLPDVFAKIRSLAPERIILARSIWAEEAKLSQILRAGLNENGEGLLIPLPQDLLAQENLAEEVESLKAEVNKIRQEVVQEASRCELWMPDVCLLNQHPYQDLVLQLYDLGCILFGDYVQASGETFSYYIDLRKIISKPQIFQQVLNAYADILKNLNFDRIAGIPYGSLPTATGLSLHLNYPMIFPRKEVKVHGTRRLIEGNFQPGETIVVVDDILISGKSAMEGADKLKSGGLIVNDIVVFLDHKAGVKERLKQKGYHAHSVLSISDITSTLYEAGKISEEQFGRFAEN
ncbi:MAG: bifunctional orotidine-5'-phosphate decarboxylase/orotate phosphoribosyltransferase [Spirulinaceae cyanobacterium]